MATINGTAGADTLNGTSADDEINGLDGNDLLIGGGGRDTLNGGVGADTMDGGNGNTTFIVDNVDDVLRGSTATIITSVSYKIPDSFAVNRAEIRAAASAGPINLTGTVYGDIIIGNESANIIDGGFPAISQSRDNLRGMGGDDTYIVYEGNNIVFEDADQGFDTVLLAEWPGRPSSYALNFISGVNGAPSIERFAMFDPASTFSSTMTGNQVSQTIVGNAGNNTINGNGGTDTLIGLAGDDTYIVDIARDIAQPAVGTVNVVERANEGFDTILVTPSGSNPTFRLGGGTSIEAITAANTASTAAINLFGNEQSQIITGNAGANILVGGGATSGGGDTLVGLAGNDTYQVNSIGDVVIEENGGGTDIVYTSLSYNLGSNEVEALSTADNAGTGAINLVGNFVSQLIVGNFGNNLLNGGSGADTLIGLRGNDLYAVGDSRIIIQEAAGEGDDTVVTSVNYALGAGVSVEVLSAQDRSSTVGLALTGNGSGQTIAGTAGADTLNGGGGNDVLIGGAGADRFAFTSALGSGNVDAIADFQAGTDRIGLASDVFAGVGSALDAGEFVAGTAAADADDRIIYNAANGQILYDADGNGSGAAVLFALVTPGTALTAASFEVIAPVATAV